MNDKIHGVRLSNPDKVLYPEQGITKRGLAEYYESIAEWILPFVRLRPISLVRCPAGRAHKCFFQRHAGSGIPPQIKEIDIAGFEESGAYLYLTNTAGLIALVQMGVLEIHPWGCRTNKPERPDRITFDLDPGEGLTFKDVVAGAKDVRDFLTKMGLKSFVKTTGGKGLHVQLPIARRYSWPEVKSFARRAAELIAASAPDRYLTRIPKAERKRRIFIDYLRNDPTSTSVAAYSTRARPGAPVSTPLHWDELSPDIDPAKFNVETIPQRLRRLRRNPWSDIDKLHQPLPKFPK
jgi:bifunctional non-homologous end joining protein LigD